MKLIAKYSCGIVAAMAVASLTLTAFADHHEEGDKKNPKDTHDVMEWGHKGKDSIAARVKDGKGTAEEIDLLVVYYNVMAKSKPPEGDMDSWKTKTQALVKTINNVKAKKPNAVAEYKEALNCKACHKLHKPKDD